MPQLLVAHSSIATYRLSPKQQGRDIIGAVCLFGQTGCAGTVLAARLCSIRCLITVVVQGCHDGNSPLIWIFIPGGRYKQEGRRGRQLACAAAARPDAWPPPGSAPAWTVAAAAVPTRPAARRGRACVCPCMVGAVELGYGTAATRPAGKVNVLL